MNRRSWKILSLAADAIAVNAAIVLSFLIRYGWPIPTFNFEAYLRVSIPLTLSQLFIFYLVDLYEPTADRSGPELLGAVGLGVVVGGLVLVALTFFFRAFSFPRSVIAISLVVQIVLVWGWRRIAAGYLHVKWPERRVLLVGEGDDLRLVADRLKAAGNWGYCVTAVVVEKAADLPKLEGYRVIEGLDSLPGLLRDLDPDQVILASPSKHRRLLEDTVLGSSFEGEIWVVPQLYEMHLGRLSFSLLGDIPLVRLTTGVKATGLLRRKSAIERVLAGLILLLCSPLLLLIGLAVLLGSGSPVFYRQFRVGKEQRQFSLVKFRTMVRDAEEEGPVLAVPGDRRITAIGGFLRRSRMDELPQLWNVVRGEMSLVGPRPERPEFVRQYIASDPSYAERFRIRPGITGLAQVSSYYATAPSVKLRFDLMYMYHQSLRLDLQIVARTLKVVVTGKGAN
jgi:exopolysaccharide biosynthesis polyprenyl glycosylphosphotransferase